MKEATYTLIGKPVPRVDGAIKTKAVALCQISRKGMAVVGEGSYDPTEEAGVAGSETAPGGHAPAYKFSTAAAEVAVDQETGRVKIEKLTFEKLLRELRKKEE